MVEGIGQRAKTTTRHILHVQEETREWLDEKFLQVAAMVGVSAAGEAAEGFLSNPANTLFILGGVGGIAAAIVGEKGIRSVVDYFSALQTLLDAKTGDEKSRAASDLAETMKKLIRFFSPLGPLTPLS